MKRMPFQTTSQGGRSGRRRRSAGMAECAGSRNTYPASPSPAASRGRGRGEGFSRRRASSRRRHPRRSCRPGPRRPRRRRGRRTRRHRQRRHHRCRPGRCVPTRRALGRRGGVCGRDRDRHGGPAHLHTAGRKAIGAVHGAGDGAAGGAPPWRRLRVGHHRVPQPLHVLLQLGLRRVCARWGRTEAGGGGGGGGGQCQGGKRRGGWRESTRLCREHPSHVVVWVCARTCMSAHLRKGDPRADPRPLIAPRRCLAGPAPRSSTPARPARWPRLGRPQSAPPPAPAQRAHSTAAPAALLARWSTTQTVVVVVGFKGRRGGRGFTCVRSRRPTPQRQQRTKKAARSGTAR